MHLFIFGYWIANTNDTHIYLIAQKTKILPDFTWVDTKFFVEKATGEVIHQYRTIAGAWEEDRTVCNMRWSDR